MEALGQSKIADPSVLTCTELCNMAYVGVEIDQQVKTHFDQLRTEAMFTPNVANFLCVDTIFEVGRCGLTFHCAKRFDARVKINFLGKFMCRQTGTANLNWDCNIDVRRWDVPRFVPCKTVQGVQIKWEKFHDCCHYSLIILLYSSCTQWAWTLTVTSPRKRPT